MESAATPVSFARPVSTIQPNQATSVRPAPTPLSFNDRMAQVFATRQSLIAQTARLESKLNDLKRWDAPAQEKFRRAFGTIDDTVRLRVAKAIEQQIIRNRQTVAALGEGVNFEFYLQSKHQ